MTTTRTKMTKSGHCLAGHCEGTKPVSPSGKPFPVCISIDWCKCKCHADINKMYELTGLPREIADNPDFRNQKRDFWMPDDDDVPAANGLSSDGGVIGPPDTERGSMPPPHVATVPVFAPTPTGRRARGQLEFDVLEVCRDFAAEVFDWEACTPKLVSLEIGKRHSIEPPSTGAINAVWNRWEKLGICTQASKPSRFTGWDGNFTGSVIALERLKSKTKAAVRRGESELRRGIRPPQPR